MIGRPIVDRLADALDRVPGCRASFLGIVEGGRRITIAFCEGADSVTQSFSQAELRRRHTLEMLCGADWLRRTFPRYELVKFPEGLGLVITDYDEGVAFDWIIDRCFEAAGFIAPSDVA